MANKRNLKKDINYLTGELVADCYTYLYLYPENKQEPIVDIISEAINNREDFIARLNSPKLAEGETMKKYYKNLAVDVMKNTEKLFGDIQKLNK